MTWTYDPTQLETSQMMQVRLRIGDTISSTPLLQDEEINLTLSQRNSIPGAAAMSAHIVAARFSRLADTTTGSVKISHAQKADAYRKLAADLEAQDDQFGGATPFAGGISISDMNTVNSDADRVPNNFIIGQTDYPEPYGQAPVDESWDPWP
jgi:hypothetical protein